MTTSEAIIITLLDRVLEKFGDLPTDYESGADRHDYDDFARDIRRLKAIVLARSSNAHYRMVENLAVRSYEEKKGEWVMEEARQDVAVVDGIEYRVRKDLVLLQYRKKGMTRGGVALPDVSAEGREWVVLAVGPEPHSGVTPGEVYMVMGQIGSDVVRLPGSSDLYLTKEANLGLCVKEVAS